MDFIWAWPINARKQHLFPYGDGVQRSPPMSSDAIAAIYGISITCGFLLLVSRVSKWSARREAKRAKWRRTLPIPMVRVRPRFVEWIGIGSPAASWRELCPFEVVYENPKPLPFDHLPPDHLGEIRLDIEFHKEEPK